MAPPSPHIEDDILTIGLLNGQPENEGAVALPSFQSGDPNSAMDATPPEPPVKEPQVWEKPLTIPTIRKSSNNWSLASDAGLLLYLQEFSQKMLTKTSDLEKKMDALVHEAKSTDSRVHNVFNDFLMLANTQFIENRVYDDSEETEQKADTSNNGKEDQIKTREQREAEVIPRVMKALNLGINVLDTAFEQLDTNVDNSDSEEEDATYRAVIEPLLEPKDLYAHRALPFLIGSPAFIQDDSVGVAEISEEEISDEGSVISSDKLTSESESEYSDSGSESESESDVSAKLKNPMQQGKSNSDSEGGGLFDQDDASSETDDEQSKNATVANKVAAKIGTANMEDNEVKRDRTISEVSGTSMSSKKRKKEAKKDKSGKRRSASKTSGDVFGEPIPDEDEASPFGTKGGLFSSSTGARLFTNDQEDEEKGGLFDEPSQAQLSSPRDDHVYEDITASEKYVATTKSGRKVPAGAVALFGEAGGEDDLFGSSPKSKEAGESSRKHRQAEKATEAAPSGGGGLFDDEDDGLFAAPASKPSKKKTAAAKKSVDLFDDNEDGDLFGSNSPENKPVESEPPFDRKDSVTKKHPAGAVSMFGTVDPLVAMQGNAHREDHVDTGPKEKTKQSPSEKPSDIFDEEDEDIDNSTAKNTAAKTTNRKSMFADAEDKGLFHPKTIHVSATDKLTISKPGVGSKKPSTGSLFDDIGAENDGDDDFFGAAATSKPKETTKKKPAGGVALFGKADMYSPSSEDTVTVKKREKPSKARTTLSLFDNDDDEKDDDALFGDAPKTVDKPPPLLRHRTKSKSVFDDEDVLFKIQEEAPPVDLFGSADPVKVSKPDTNKPRSASSVSKKNLFNDEDDDEDSDLFSAASKASPRPTPKPATPRPATVKPTMTSKPKVDLFGDGDEDDLFGGSSELSSKPSKSLTKKHPEPPTVKTEPLYDQKQVVSANSQVSAPMADPLFREQPSATKSKKAIGAVSVFPTVDAPPVSPTVDLGSKEEDDERSRTPSATSVTDNIIPKPFSATSSYKQVSRVQSVKAPQSKAKNRVSMLQSSLVIDPRAMRHGAAPPTKEAESLGLSFDEPPQLNTLSSLNKGRAKVSTKRRAPSRRLHAEGTAVATDGSSSVAPTSPSSTTGGRSLVPTPSPSTTPRTLSDLPCRPVLSTDPLDFGLAEKNKGKDIPTPSSTRSIKPTTKPSLPSSVIDKPEPKSLDMFDNDELFTTDSMPISEGPPPLPKYQPDVDDDGDDLFSSVPKIIDTKSPLYVDENLFAPSLGKEASSYKTKVKAKTDSEELSTESTSGTKKVKKTTKTKSLVDDDIFARSIPTKNEVVPPASVDYDNLLTSSASSKTTTVTTKKKTVEVDDEDLFTTNQTSKKSSSKSKKPDKDLFSDSTNIFHDLPSVKTKAKKNKDGSLFTDTPEGDIFATPTTTPSKPKKTKTKKKTSDKKPVTGDSIFDDSAPSIFDDPLNAMGN